MELNWHQMIDNSYHIGIAYLLALPVAWNREHEAQSAGLRTFPLVSIAACAFMLTGETTFSEEGARARVFYGIITGIGFIGGGAILKNKGEVAGTATAASIWGTGAIGTAVAMGIFELAILVSAINFLTFKLKPKRKKDSSSS